MGGAAAGANCTRAADSVYRTTESIDAWDNTHHTEEHTEWFGTETEAAEVGGGLLHGTLSSLSESSHSMREALTTAIESNHRAACVRVLQMAAQHAIGPSALLNHTYETAEGDRWTVLHHTAAEPNAEEVVQLLLDFDASVTMLDSNGAPAASRAGTYSVLQATHRCIWPQRMETCRRRCC